MKSPFWLLAGGVIAVWFVTSGRAAALVAAVNGQKAFAPAGSSGGSSSGTWGLPTGGGSSSGTWPN